MMQTTLMLTMLATASAKMTKWDVSLSVPPLFYSFILFMGTKLSQSWYASTDLAVLSTFSKTDHVRFQIRPNQHGYAYDDHCRWQIRRG